MYSETLEAPSVDPSVPEIFDPKPMIFAGDNTARTIKEMVSAIAPYVWTHNGQLVEIVDGRILPIVPARLISLVSEHVEYCKPKGNVEIPISESLARSILAEPAYPGVREVKSIVQTPFVKACGVVVNEPGYDEDSKTLCVFEPSRFPTIPAAPSRDEAIDAADEILSLVKDFPFFSKVDRHAYLALILSIALRPVLAASIPLFALDAKKNGAGKGLLLRTAMLLGMGRIVPAFNGAAERESTYKDNITTAVREGRECMFFDNVPSDTVFGSPAVSQCISERHWADRIKGHSRSIEGSDLRIVWLVNGNNIQLGDDVGERTIMITLESPYVNHRREHKYEELELLKHVKARPELICRVMTLLAWCVQNKRREHCWGTFNEWCWMIAMPLEKLGYGGTLTLRDRAQNCSEREASQSEFISMLLETVEEGKSYSARELYTEIMLNGKDYCDELKIGSSRSMGKHLSACEGWVGLDDVRQARIVVTPKSGNRRSYGIEVRDAPNNAIAKTSTDILEQKTCK